MVFGRVDMIGDTNEPKRRKIDKVLKFSFKKKEKKKENYSVTMK